MKKNMIQHFVMAVLLGMVWLIASPLAAQNLLSDPGFEAGTPNPAWNEVSTFFGTPLCTVSSCGTGTGTGAHTGDWWAWFGGIIIYEESEVSQSVTIPEGTASLSFWLEIPVGSGNATDYLQVSIDDNPVFTVYENTPGYGTYTKVMLDISSYADGNTHNLKFSSITYGAGTTNFFVDDVEILSDPTPPPVPLSPVLLMFVVLMIAGFLAVRYRKKTIFIAMIAIASMAVFASFDKDASNPKADVLSAKKASDLKERIMLDNEQEKLVQELFQQAYNNLYDIMRQKDASKEEKIIQYNKNSRTLYEGLRKVLTPEQFEEYISTERGR